MQVSRGLGASTHAVSPGLFLAGVAPEGQRSPELEPHGPGDIGQPAVQVQPVPLIYKLTQHPAGTGRGRDTPPCSASLRAPPAAVCGGQTPDAPDAAGEWHTGSSQSSQEGGQQRPQHRGAAGTT